MRDVSPTLLWSDPNPGQQFEYSHDERLIRMVARTSVGPQQRIDFTYDWQGRRIGKQVWNDTAGAGASTLEKFIYDGWNLMTIEGPRNRTFLWGLDLSGSMQGAGGVGGLLAVNDKTAGIASFVCYDGNGNVVGLVNTAGTSLTAQYEYGPFGELLRATGPMAKANPFRFSTKYQDDETDLLYFGYRYYSSSTGRWLSRDPLGEVGFGQRRLKAGRSKGASKLATGSYVSCRNDSVSKWDYLGLDTGPCPATDGGLDFNGYMSLYDGRIACLYHKCGSDYEYTRKIRTGGDVTQRDEWIGTGMFDGYCVTYTFYPATGQRIKVSCGCASKVVYYTNTKPMNRIKEEDTSSSGSETVVSQWDDLDVTEVPNGKSYFDCTGGFHL